MRGAASDDNERSRDADGWEIDKCSHSSQSAPRGEEEEDEGVDGEPDADPIPRRTTIAARHSTPRVRGKGDDGTADTNQSGSCPPGVTDAVIQYISGILLQVDREQMNSKTSASVVNRASRWVHFIAHVTGLGIV
jgi:hypothetical protein